MWKAYEPGETIVANTIGIKAIGIDGIMPLEEISTAGPDRNAHVQYIPSPNRTDSWWYPDASGSNPTYTITLPDAAIMEYTVDVIIADGNTPIAGVSSGMTTNLVYYNTLGNALYLQAEGHNFSVPFTI